MPACYDMASPGPPTLDEGGPSKYKFGSQPREKVTRPLDRRAASLLVRERVEKARKVAPKPEVEQVEGRSPVPKSPRSDDGQQSARSLTKEEKVQLINESANHPYLKRLLQGMHVQTESNVRPTNSSQLRERQHKKQGATFAVPPPLFTDQSPSKNTDDETPLTPSSFAGEMPPPWLLSKHSLLNKGSQQKQVKKKVKRVARSPTRAPNTARLPERKSELSPALHTRRVCVDDAKNYPELTQLRHVHEDKSKEDRDNENENEGEKEEGEGDFYSKLQGALTRLASDTPGTDTETSPARSRSSPAPIPAKQLRLKRSRGRKMEKEETSKGERTPMGTVTPNSKTPRGTSSEPKERGAFSARPSYSPRRPLPSPGRDASKSPRPYLGAKPVWRS